MIRLTGDTSYPSEHSRPDGRVQEPDELDLMDHLSAGFLLVDENLQVLRSNRSAVDLLKSAGGDGFVRTLGHTVTLHAAELRKNIRETISKKVRSVLLLRPGSARALICNIRPVAGDPTNHALVALTPLSGGSTDVIPYLKTIYKLSNAEAEIAAAAAAGMDVIQMAQGRQVSIHTLRAQVAAIKAKMGLSRMTEIAVMVGRIEASVTWF